MDFSTLTLELNEVVGHLNGKMLETEVPSIHKQSIKMNYKPNGNKQEEYHENNTHLRVLSKEGNLRNGEVEKFTQTLKSKEDFGRLNPLNVKPSDGTEGFTENKIDSDEPEYREQKINSTVSYSPNSYKEKGEYMSKIPYLFETPIPKYFREAGWFKNENTWKYVNWAFSKCQTQPHKQVIEGKEITLAPYEFISGRLSSPKECFLTENIFRNQQKMLVNAGFLKKSTNSKTNHYTCYIWVTDRFYKIDNQQNNQPRTNHAPTVNHKSEDKKIRREEDHPSIPSYSSDGLIDDFLRKEKEKIHIYETIYLTQSELDECIKVKGSIENVKDSIQKIQDDPKRNQTIKNWASTLEKWKFPNNHKKKMEDNESIAKKIVDAYCVSTGWSVRMYRDTVKDDRGILFECLGSSAGSLPKFISISDHEFKEKSIQFLKDKKMKKKGEK